MTRARARAYACLLIAAIWACALACVACDERLERGRVARMQRAEAWVKQNRLDATVTCYPAEWTCDVVAKGARPFKIVCYGGDQPCRLPVDP